MQMERTICGMRLESVYGYKRALPLYGSDNATKLDDVRVKALCSIVLILQGCDV